MAFDVRFYTFNKNPNSTKQPAGIEPETFSCVLIESTSIVNPQIAIVGNRKPIAYNYAFIPEFNRYYFVNDWVYNAGRWTANLNVDVLASWRGDIGSSTQYVLRSASEFDGDIVDTKYLTNAKPVIKLGFTDFYHDYFKSDLKDGTYILGIINGDEASQGAIAYYAFTHDEIRKLVLILTDEKLTWVDTASEVAISLIKSLFDPLQYIVSCYWYPFKIAGVKIEALPFGWLVLPNVTCSRLMTSVKITNLQFEIPKHPQAEERGFYLNNAPYSRYYLKWRPLGYLSLDTTWIAAGGSVIIFITTDLYTGKGFVSISGNSGTIAITEMQVGVPIQLSKVVSNVVTELVEIIPSTITNVSTGNVMGVLGSIGDFIYNSIPKASTFGTNGSSVSYIDEPFIECEYFMLVDEDNKRNGRPLCKNTVINEMTGFIQTSNATISGNMTLGEQNEIKQHMDTGFFYE